ncbi:MAG: hypothetical protein GXX10_01780 [Clostridiaceae bacterium]|nr:hypothetical protein [Clostridiaceae bacterium]
MSKFKVGDIVRILPFEFDYWKNYKMTERKVMYISVHMVTPMSSFADEDGRAPSAHEILHGEWYVE